MPVVRHLRIAIDRRRRLIAGLWFASFAFIASAMMYLGPSLQRDVPTGVLYLGCPPVSGFFAGYVLGHRVFAVTTYMRAASVGLAVVIVAFAVFAVLYALTYSWVSGGSQRPLALLLSIFSVGLVATAPLTVPIGLFAGCALLYLRRVLSDGSRSPG